MNKDVRNRIQRNTQSARALLEREFAEQLEGLYDIRTTGSIADQPSAHLDEHGRLAREKLLAAIDHHTPSASNKADAVAGYLREAAFTSLNRFVALKMLEARSLIQECISRGDKSSGFREFVGLAPGTVQLEDHGYQLYLESIFDEVGQDIGVLFDRRDPAGLLWPRRQALNDLLTILNDAELLDAWNEDETIGWVYQYFNSGDERKKMRDASQAPRNSRELAVRNQFFTPRYVVQFLADNTLGRLWLEMQGEKTALAKRCEYLVRTTDEPTQPRPKQDPRDLRILDPACGSGHFLLYSFDLLLTIYEEAWEDESFDLQSQTTGQTLRKDYPDLEALRRAAPGLIVEHNLHGVEIDPRCAQIAALALWLRAQRAWNEAGMPARERPSLRRTHIVVAEPIPGNGTLAEEFAARLDPPLLRELFKKIVDEMRLAGDLGTLLRVENGIAVELSRAREQLAKQRQTTGFLPGLEPVRNQGELDLSGIDDDAFFHEAEARILEALRGFAEAATGSASVRRRLFAGDAAAGVALIDLLRTRFDVVLMNPPFGACSLAAKREFEKSYPRTRNDLYAAFVERGVELLRPRGLLGAITSRTGFFLSSFQKWREEILLKEAPPVVFADLGYGVLDSAMVEVAAYCLEKGPGGTTMKTVFLRALDADDKAAALRAIIHPPEPAAREQRFEVDAAGFAAVPRAPFTYWVSERLRKLFVNLPPFASDGRGAKHGAATLDDVRFVRAWVEVPSGDAIWVPFAKGGSNAPFYSDIDLVLQWAGEGAELKANASMVRARNGWGDQWTAVLNGYSYYFRPGVTWPHRSATFSASALPAGCVFSQSGKAAFVDSADLETLLALFNAATMTILARIQSDAVRIKFEAGLVERTPFPVIPAGEAAELSALARRAWSLRRSRDTHTEASHAFTLPAVLQMEGATLAAQADGWGERVRASDAELVAIQAEIDKRCFDLYEIDEADRGSIIDGFGGSADQSDEPAAEAEASPDEEAGAESSDTAALTAELLSWAVGVAFGRFDVRLATGGRDAPAEPEPFDPLPVCSPAMLTDEDGLPLASAPAGFPLAFPEDGILVDDPGDPRDLTAAVRAVFEVVFGARADAFWEEAAALLDPKGQSLRQWLASGFFEHHLKRHSKSRRKAPIVWQLGLPSGRYSVWLYAHRLTGDSFFQVQNDVVAPKLVHEERRLASLIQNSEGSSSAKERKEIAAQETFVEELRALLEEIKRVAPLWSPTLDDGVVLAMAPLWRLVPQHKPWQRELKTKWEQLIAGEYDWAHIAMSLWPERVVPKCATDRSFAIAHGLEDTFWVEGGDGKWEHRSVPARPVEELINERSSLAIQAALQASLDRPAVPAGDRRRPAVV
jgi:hypothetical protein